MLQFEILSFETFQIKQNYLFYILIQDFLLTGQKPSTLKNEHIRFTQIQHQIIFLCSISSYLVSNKLIIVYILFARNNAAENDC